MKIKNIGLLLMIIASLYFNACNKDDSVFYADDPYTNIELIKGLYKGQDLLLDSKNTQGKAYFFGVVISDATSKNIAEGDIVIQGENAGIIMSMGTTAKHSFVVGDSVMVDFWGGTIQENLGNLQISGLSPDKIIKAASVTPKVTSVTLSELDANFSKYESMLVKIDTVEVTPFPNEGDTYSGDKGLDDGTGSPGIIMLHTSAEATYATKEVEEMANYTGIALWNNSTKQICLRNENDIEVSVIEGEIKATVPDIVITGIVFDAGQNDGPYFGQVIKGITCPGGFEYFQFMAMKDIDFSVNPYSVVCCNAYTSTSGANVVTEQGWAEGKTQTFKFNLTSGTAKKGTFFYVGGTGKVICGILKDNSSTYVLSTDISDANWIRAIDYNANDASIVTGDGFGNSSGGIIGNGNDPGADGLAVFEGTEVTSGSVPIDAVFFGIGIGAAYVDETKGYRIAENELYNPIDAESGTSQPFFGQGANTFLFPNEPAANLYFLKLIGKVSSELKGTKYKNKWIERRSAYYELIQWNSPLSQIETGYVFTLEVKN